VDHSPPSSAAVMEG